MVQLFSGLFQKKRCFRIIKISAFSKDDSLLRYNNNRKLTIRNFSSAIKFPQYNEQKYREIIFFEGLLWEDEEYFRDLLLEQYLIENFRERVRNLKMSRRFKRRYFKTFFRAILKMLLIFLENGILSRIDMLNSRFLFFIYFLTKLTTFDKFAGQEQVVRKKKYILRNFFFIYIFFLGRLKYLRLLDSGIELRRGRYLSYYKETAKKRIRRFHLVLYSPYKISSVNNFKYFLTARREEWDARIGLLLKKVSFFQKEFVRSRKKKTGFEILYKRFSNSYLLCNYKKRLITNYYRNFFIFKKLVPKLAPSSLFVRKYKFFVGRNNFSGILKKSYFKKGRKIFPLSFFYLKKSRERSFFRIRGCKNNSSMFFGGLRSFLNFFDRFSIFMLTPIIYRIFWLRRTIKVLDDKKKLKPWDVMKRWRRFLFPRLKRKFFELPNYTAMENFVFGEGLNFVLQSFFSRFKRIDRKKAFKFFKFGKPKEEVLNLKNYFKFWRRRRKYFTSIFLKKVQDKLILEVNKTASVALGESLEFISKESLDLQATLFINSFGFPASEYVKKRIKGREAKIIFWCNLVCHINQNYHTWFQTLFSKKFGFFFVQNILTYLQKEVSFEPLIPRWGSVFFKIFVNYFYFYYIMYISIIKTEILLFDINKLLEEFRDLPIFLHYPLLTKSEASLEFFRSCINKSNKFSEVLDSIILDFRDGVNKRFFDKLISSFADGYLSVEPKAPFVELELARQTFKQQEAFLIITHDILEGMLRVGYPPKYALAQLAEMFAFKPYVAFTDTHKLDKPKFPLVESFTNTKFTRHPYKFKIGRSRFKARSRANSKEKLKFYLKVKKGIRPLKHSKKLIRKNMRPYFDAAHKKMQWLPLRHFKFSLKEKVERRWLRRKRSVHAYFFKRYLKTYGVFYNIYKIGAKVNFFGFFHRVYDTFFSIKRVRFFIAEEEEEDKEEEEEDKDKENMPKIKPDELIARISFCTLSAIVKLSIANFTSVLFRNLQSAGIYTNGRSVVKAFSFLTSGRIPEKLLIFDFYLKNWLLSFKNSHMLSILYLKDVFVFLQDSYSFSISDYWHILLFFLRRMGFLLLFFRFVGIFSEFKDTVIFFFYLKNHFLSFKPRYGRYCNVVSYPLESKCLVVDPLFEDICFSINFRSVFIKSQVRCFQTLVLPASKSFRLKFRKYKFGFFCENFFHKFNTLIGYNDIALVLKLKKLKSFFSTPKILDVKYENKVNFFDEFLYFDILSYQFFKKNYSFWIHIDIIRNRLTCLDFLYVLNFDYSRFFKFYPINLLYYSNKQTCSNFLVPLKRQKMAFLIPGFYTFFNFSMRDFFSKVAKLKVRKRKLKRKISRRNRVFYMNFHKRILSRNDLKNLRSVKLEQVPMAWFKKLRFKRKIEHTKNAFRRASLRRYRPFQHRMVKNEDTREFRNYLNSSTFFFFKYQLINYLAKGDEKRIRKIRISFPKNSLNLAKILHLNKLKYKRKKKVVDKIMVRRLKSDFLKFNLLGKFFNRGVDYSKKVNLFEKWGKFNLNYLKTWFAVTKFKKSQIFSKRKSSQFLVSWFKDTLKGGFLLKPRVRRLIIRYNLMKGFSDKLIKYSRNFRLGLAGKINEIRKDVFYNKILIDAKKKSSILFVANMVVRKYMKILFHINYQLIVFNSYLFNFLSVNLVKIQSIYDVFSYFNSYKLYYSFFPTSFEKGAFVLKNIVNVFETFLGLYMSHINITKFLYVKNFFKNFFHQNIFYDFVLICGFLKKLLLSPGSSIFFFSNFSIYREKLHPFLNKKALKVRAFRKVVACPIVQFLRFYIFVQNCLGKKNYFVISLKYLSNFFSKSFLFSLKRKNFLSIKYITVKKPTLRQRNFRKRYRRPFVKKRVKKHIKQKNVVNKHIKQKNAVNKRGKKHIKKRNVYFIEPIKKVCLKRKVVIFKPSFFLSVNESLSVIIYQLLTFSLKKSNDRNFVLFDFQCLLSFFVGLFIRNIVQFFRFYSRNRKLISFDIVMSSLFNNLFKKSYLSGVVIKKKFLRKVVFFFSFVVLKYNKRYKFRLPKKYFKSRKRFKPSKKYSNWNSFLVSKLKILEKYSNWNNLLVSKEFKRSENKGFVRKVKKKVKSALFLEDFNGKKDFLGVNSQKTKFNLKWKLLIMRGLLKTGLRKFNRILKFAKKKTWYSMKFLYKQMSFQQFLPYKYSKDFMSKIGLKQSLKITQSLGFRSRQYKDLLRVKYFLSSGFFTSSDPICVPLGNSSNLFNLAVDRKPLRKVGLNRLLADSAINRFRLFAKLRKQRLGYSYSKLPKPRRIQTLFDRVKFPIFLRRAFVKWPQTEWYNKHTFKPHLNLSFKLYPYMKHKIFLGSLMSPKFFNFSTTTKPSFFFSNFELNTKMKKRVSVFLKLHRFLEYLVKISLKVRSKLLENLQMKDSQTCNKNVVLEFFSDNVFSFLFVVYRKAKAMLKVFFDGILKESEAIFRGEIFRPNVKSYFFQTMVSFYLNRVQFGFFYNLLSIFFLKFFILRFFFGGDYLRLRFQFVNRFFWYRLVPLFIYMRNPRFFFVVTKFRNNFFLSAIDVSGRLYYKCSPGMLGYTGTDRMSKYAWFDTSVRFFEGFITFLFRFFYLKRARRRRVTRSRGMKEKEKIKSVARVFRKQRLRRLEKIHMKEFFFRLKPSSVFAKYLDSESFAWWQKEEKLKEVNRKLKKKSFRGRWNERGIIGLNGFFVIAKGITNFDLRIFLRGIFSDKNYKYKKCYLGAVKYPKRSFSLCRIKKVRRI